MRCYHADWDYFAFLDALRGEAMADAVLAAAMLAREFPGLRLEEARAVYADWRSLRRCRRPVAE